MQTFADPLTRALAVSPEGIAIACGSTQLTYADLWDRCRRLAGFLRDAGLEPGDRVAITAANCHRYIEAYLAVPAAGFALVPLNTRHTEAELAYALSDSGARVLITDREPGGLADIVEHVISIPDAYEAALSGATAAPLGEEVTPETLAGLFYTGGTTGAAKGVMLTHANLIANAWTMLACGRLTEADRWLVMAPLFHAAGSIAVLASVWTGGRQVVLPAFDPGRALDLIESEAITITLGVPTMVAAMAEEQIRQPRDTGSLRQLEHGGSPIATEVVRRAAKAFPSAELVHLYGATETAPIATVLADEQNRLDGPQARSCGQPAIGVQVRVVDSHDVPTPPGEVGEVVIRGNNVMLGYWNKAVETAAALRDGWYHTGDLGYLDDRSYLYLVDRLKDMIVTGGENVYSTEVEEALYSHPAVLEAAVFGVPSVEWGEAVHAEVVLREAVGDHASVGDDLIEHCRGLIAGYKLPKTIVVREEPLPKSGAGKVLKGELRAPHWAGRHEQV